MDPRFSILSGATGDSGATLLSPLYVTNDKDAWEGLLTQIRAIVANAPGLRPPTKGNRRKVKLFDLADAEQFAHFTRSGKLSPSLRVGQVFGSLQDAGRALGLGDRTLAQLFTEARREQGTSDPVVTVRAVRLCYADQRQPKIGA